MSPASEDPALVPPHPLDVLEPRRPVDLVIFDCDGVLIDSEIISARVLLGELAARGASVDYAYFKAHFLGRSFPKVVEAVRRDFGLRLEPDFEEDYRGKLLATFDRELKPVEGIVEVLTRLAPRSCVATSSTPRRAAHSLKVTGLASYFGDRVFTASEVANGKPAPDLFLHAATRCGVSPEACLVIEDSLPGLTAARAAQMQVLHFVGASHLGPEDARTQGLTPPVPFFDTWARFFAMGRGLDIETPSSLDQG